MKNKEFESIRALAIQAYAQGILLQIVGNAFNEARREEYLKKYGYGFKAFIPTGSYIRIIKEAVN